MRGCCSGAWYNGIQAATHKKPSKLGSRNAAGHPMRSVKKTSSGGAMMDPTIDPPLKTPTASARSLAGYHCEMTFIAPEKFPHSHVPNQKRKTENCIIMRAKT